LASALIADFSFAQQLYQHNRRKREERSGISDAMRRYSSRRPCSHIPYLRESTQEGLTILRRRIRKAAPGADPTVSANDEAAVKIWHGVALDFRLRARLGRLGLWRVHGELDRSRAHIDDAARLAVERSAGRLRSIRSNQFPRRRAFCGRGDCLTAASGWRAARGLFRYSPQGELLRSWLVGSDLPQARPTRLAVGLDPVSQRQALFVATAGAGLLIVNSSWGRGPILPAEPGCTT
jgi:hypothetical protein